MVDPIHRVRRLVVEVAGMHWVVTVVFAAVLCCCAGGFLFGSALWAGLRWTANRVHRVFNRDVPRFELR